MDHLWGSSRIVHQENRLIVVRATSAGDGGASSIHFHRQHVNGLAVLEGHLVLEQFDDCDRLTMTRDLLPGHGFRVMPGVSHRISFPAGPTEIMEWYAPRSGIQATLADIVRVSPGIRASP